MNLIKVLNELYTKATVSIILTVLFASCLWLTQILASGESPVITYPSENQVVNEGNIQITWDSIPGVSTYTCQITDLTSGSTVKSIHFSTTYTYRVRAGHSYEFSAMANYDSHKDTAYSSEPSIVHFSVDVLASNVTVKPKSLSLKTNETELLTAEVSPSNATNKDITWDSSDNSVATVDSSGLVTGISPGTATIYGSTVDGGSSGSCKVTVISDTVSVASVTLSPKKLSMQTGQTDVLKATVMPSNAADASVTWTTSDSSVVTVSEYGEVEAVSEGTATITVKTADGNKSDTCVVTVKSSKISVASVSISNKNLSLQADETGELTATVAPSNATNKSVAWSTSDSAVAVVSDEGEVTAVSAGSAIITAKTADGNKTAVCVVTVKSSPAEVDSVSISKKTLSLQSGKTGTLTATVKPSSAADKSVIWTTSDPSVATVDKNGVVTAVSAGSAVITVTTTQGSKTAACTVTVTSTEIAVKSVSLSPKTLTLQNGETGVLTAKITPSNATNPSLTWTTSDSSVATVNETGEVKAVSAGSTVITVKTNDGNKTAACTVTVKPEPAPTYLVNFSADNGGSIKATVDGKKILSGESVQAGKTVNFTALPQNDWAVKEWKVNGSVVESSTESYVLLDVKESVQVTVEFSSTLLTGTTAISPRSTTVEAVKFSSYFPRGAQSIDGFLVQNHDKTISHITPSDNDGIVYIETADSNGSKVSSKEIAYELPIFASFFSGENYNFIVFGQSNAEKNKSKEVIRIVKYDKNFNKLGSASVNGGDVSTEEPFRAAGARMAEKNGKLVLHTGRRRFDGHQSNLTIAVDIDTMNVTHQSALFPSNHVSHSFDQYMLFDGVQPVFLDHGDAYPRSIVLKRNKSEDLLSKCDEATMFKIPGAVGANYTGVTIGGFGMSSKNYIAAITTIDHSKAKKYTSYEIVGLDLDQRDIVVCVLPKSFKSGTTASQTTIAKYVGTDKIASTPKMLSNGDESFTLFWQEFSISGTPGDYVVQTISSNGTVSGSEKRYNNISEFYQEFCKVSALPASFITTGGSTVNQQAETQPAGVMDTPIANISNASEWAENSITQALEKGFVPPYLQNRYTEVINREEFCRMAVSWLEYITGKDIDTFMAEKGVKRSPGVFTDTNDNDILAAYALGITSGTGGGRFSPYDNFTREQAAAMILNTCRAIGANVSNPPSSNFADMGSASDWAVNGINYCRDKGIMQGVGSNNFSPKATYTIEQSIITFNNIDLNQINIAN